MTERRNLPSSPWGRSASFFVAALFLFFSACSDSETNLCEGVECPVGVCQADTGECGNPDTCVTGEDCLPGYACEVGTCFAEIPCSDESPCERGVCTAGACTNAQICSEKAFCLPSYDCVDNTCAYDACTDVSCARGVCEASTGECVNADVCTIGTERDDCLDDYFCYGQVCTTGDEVCQEIECDRGVCEASIQGCVNGISCETDAECIVGFFCDETSNCRPNICDDEFILCARGVCEVNTGDCINAAPCKAANECTDGFTCIGESCVPVGEECGLEGCVGNRICDLEPETLSASCIENPNGCWRALDCDNGRVCLDGVCSSPLPCDDDSHEPNNTALEATDFNTVSVGASIDASLCRNDIDIFAFDIDQDPDFQGKLIVDLQYLREDEGLGALKLELIAPDGNVVDTVEGDTGRLRIEHVIGILNRGVYSARISDVSASFAGIRYGLYMDVVPNGLAGACLDAPEILAGTSVTGDSGSGQSVQLGSSCTSPDNDAPEDIWRFDLDDPAYVTVRVTPDTTNALTFSVRERCELLGSEIACVDTRTASSLVYQAPLGPGSYYIVVQGTQANQSDAYGLTFTSTPIVCGPADTVCIDASNSRFCRPERTGFTTEFCALGCDEESGRCIRSEGDVCRTAIDATGGYSGAVDWSTFESDFDPGETCVPNNSGTQSDGPDAVYRVVLQPDTLVEATLTRSTGDFVSLYITDDCDALPNSCLIGANAAAFGNESIFWANDTGAEKEIFVVADIEADTSYRTSSIAISTAPVVCTPNEIACVGPFTLESCNDRGTVVSTTNCSFGCDLGACNSPPNDTCSTALDLNAEPGNTFTANIEEYSGTETPGFSGCTGRSASGPDAAFTFSAPAGQVITVDLNATFDGALWVTTDCADTAGSCVAGSDASGTGIEQIQFLSDAAANYVIFVDASSSVAAGSFTITASAQAPTCLPGTSLGCANANELSYCSDLGVPASYTCATTCTGAACDEPSGSICIDPIVMFNGDTESGNFQGTNDLQPGTTMVGSCDFTGNVPNGTDYVHAVDLFAGQYLTASYTAGSSFAMMYIMGDCADFDSCIAVTPIDGTSGSLTYQAVNNERVYVVMDRTNSASSSLTYDLTVEVVTPDCTPGLSPPFCSDATTLSYCDSIGVTRTYTCDGSCVIDACATPTGDVCYDPIQVFPGTTVTGTFQSATNAVQPLQFDGQCIFDDASSSWADGEDIIYAVDLFQGEALSAKLTSTYSSAYMYILEDCGDTSTCVANNPRRQGDIELSYMATTTGTHYIVIDSNAAAGSSTAYSLQVDVIAGAVCAPNQNTCQGNSALLCDDFGVTYSGDYPCATSCVDGLCLPDPLRDTCGSGVALPFGTIEIDSFDNYTNDFSLTSSSCVGRTTPGPDAAYPIDVPAGSILHARVESLGYEDPAIYAITDCADAEGSCVAGAGPTSTDTAEIYYLAQNTERVWVVVDSTSSVSDEPYRVWIEVISQECAPGQTTCGADLQTLLICNDLGLYDSFDCISSCSAGACDVPSGELCFDAIPLADGESYVGDYSDFSADVDPGPNSCFLYSTNQPDGPDAVFSVDLVAGERMTANLTTTSSAAVMYVLDDCSTAPENDCRIARPESKELEFVADTTRTYYLVVDSDSTGEGAAFRVSVDIDSGYVCTPNSSVCNGGLVTSCSNDGFNAFPSTLCPGDCFNRTSCAPSPTVNNTCATATSITGSVSILGQYSDYTADLDPGSSCTGKSNPGRDAVYQVQLQANQAVEARVRASNAGDDPAVYILSSCTNPTMDCLAGASSETQFVDTSYLATTAQTVYVVVDSDSSSDSNYFQLDLAIRNAECVAGSTACSGNLLKTCSADQIYDVEDCYFGCAAGACNPTPNDTCAGAIDVTGGGVFAAPIEEYTDVYDPQPAMGAAFSCTLGDGPGPDQVYSITAQAGDFIRLEADAATDVTLWVADSCTSAMDATDSCILGADAVGNGLSEYVEFVAPTAGTYFVFVDIDSTSTTLSGLMRLEVSVTPNGVCTPDDRVCLDANTVQFCDYAGTALVQASCAGGCSNGFCGTPTADTCVDPLNVSATGSYTLNMDTMSNDYNLPTTGCLMDDTPGNDAVLVADIAANNVFDLEVTGTGSANPALYMVNSCSALPDGLDQSNCFLGAANPGASELLTYSPTANERVYVVVDALATSQDSGTWTVEVYNGPAQCSVTLPCTDGRVCVDGICRDPSGDSCALAIPMSTGDSDNKTFEGTNALDIGPGVVGNCTFPTGDTQPGTDHVYFVDLLPGQTLTASYTTSSCCGIMYITTDCTDPSSCQDNTVEGSTGTATYTATAAERVYVVMDRTTSGSTASYNYTLNVTVL